MRLARSLLILCLASIAWSACTNPAPEPTSTPDLHATITSQVQGQLAAIPTVTLHPTYTLNPTFTLTQAPTETPYPTPIMPSEGTWQGSHPNSMENASVASTFNGKPVGIHILAIFCKDDKTLSWYVSTSTNYTEGAVIPAWYSVDGAPPSPMAAYISGHSFSTSPENQKTIAQGMLKAKTTLSIGFGATQYTWKMNGTPGAANKWLSCVSAKSQ